MWSRVQPRAATGDQGPPRIGRDSAGVATTLIDHSQPAPGLAKLHARLPPAPALPRFRRLQVLMLVVACAWVAIALTLSHHLIDQSQNKLLDELHSSGHAETGHLARAFEQEFKKAEQLAATIALQNDIIDAVASMNRSAQALFALPEQERIKRLIAEPVAREPNVYLSRLSGALDIKIIYILDENGSCVIASVSARPCLGANYSERQYFRDAVTYGAGMQFAVGKMVTEPSIFFASAIMRDNRAIGAVVVRFFSEELTRLLARGDDIEFLLNDEGLIVAAADSSLLLHHTELPLAGSSREDVRRSDNTIGIQRLTGTEFRQAVWLLNDEPHLAFTVKLSGQNFYVARLAPIEDLFNARRDLWITAGLLIALGLMVIVVIERSLNFTGQRKLHLAMLSQANSELSSTARKLYEMATCDSLTGLKNHRFFMQSLASQVERCRREQKPLALISIDIDHFKTINDNFGHPVGDEVIVRLARICVELVRKDDVVGRLGGEEFAILLPDSNVDNAMAIAERIRLWCQDNPVEIDGKNIKFTCSFGVAMMQPRGEISLLLAQLDSALYQAKRSGRNRLVLADAGVDRGAPAAD